MHVITILITFCRLISVLLFTTQPCDILWPSQTKIVTLNANAKKIITSHTFYGQTGQTGTLNANTKEIITLHTCCG